MTKPSSTQPPGPGVDSEGRAVIDPTRNVLDLVAAANRRQDDLRTAEGDPRPGGRWAPRRIRRETQGSGDGTYRRDPGC